MKKISEAAMNIDGQPMFKYLDRAKKLESEGKKMIHLEIGDPDFDTPSNVTMAAIKALGNGKTHYTSSWGDPDFRPHIKNTHLTFKLPEGSKKIRFRLKIREGPMKMNSFVWLAAYIRLHVKNGDTWNTLTDVKYDYDAGYNEKYKAIYEEVTNHILTI